VGQCRATGLRVGPESREIGRCGGSDVLAHNQGDAKIDGQHAGGTQQDGYRHDRRGALDDTGDECSDQQKDENRPVTANVKAREEGYGSVVVCQVETLAGIAQQYEREE